ncbi:MAG TPA: PIN domain-containing protein [Polyangia bacterium]|nr:PIN domain-containing protein [Polyangia bacterium]
MTIVDTNVFRGWFRGEPRSQPLEALLATDEVAVHPWVLGELTLGGLPSRAGALLAALPAASVIGVDEAFALVEAHRLARAGIGWVDVNLIGAALIVRARLWTFDRALADAAARIGVAA